MPRAQLSYPVLPLQPVDIGDTSPNPGYVGAYAWSTKVNDVVMWNGIAWSPAGTSLSNYLMGLTGFAPYNTPDPGGEAGDPSTGWGTAVLFIINIGITNTYFPLASRYLTDYSRGWDWRLYNNYISDYIVGSAHATGYRWGLDERDRIFCALGRHTGTGATGITANVNELYVNRELMMTTSGSYLVPATGGTYLGGRFDSYQVGTNATILSLMTFRGKPTTAQIQSYLDEVRATGDLPKTFSGATVACHWSVRNELLNKSVDVPTTIRNQITNASSDTLTKTGAPWVTLLDTRREGRKLYGFGAMNTSWYYPPGIKPIGGTANKPFWFTISFIWSSSTSSWNRMGGYAAGGGSQGGWRLNTASNGKPYFEIALGSRVAVYFTSAGNIWGPSDRGRLIVVSCYWDGATASVVSNGVVTSTGTHTSYAAPLANAYDFTLGSGVLTSPDNIITGACGGDQVITLAEIQAQHAEVLRTQRIATIQGKTEHFWDVHADVEATYPVAPPKIIDRIGSHSLILYDPWQIAEWPTIGNISVKGFRGFSTTNYLSNSGVLQGSATGFWIAAAYYCHPQSGTLSHNTIAACTTLSTTSAGWYITARSGNGAIGVQIADGSGVMQVLASTYAAGQYSKVILVHLVWDGTTLSLYIEGVLSGQLAVTGYTPTTTTPFAVGTIAPAQGTSVAEAVMAIAGGNSVPMAAEIATQATTYRTTGVLQAIPARTDNLYDFNQDIKEAYGDFPQQIKDRAGTSWLTRWGSNALAYRKTERLWNYEASPVLYGANGFTDANYYTLDSTFDVGGGGGFYAGLLIRLDNINAAANRVLFSTHNDNFRFVIYPGANPTYNAWMRIGSGSFATTSGTTFTQADVSKLFTIMAVFDGTRFALYCKRALIGNGIAYHNFTRNLGTTYIGRAAANGQPFTGGAIFGLIAGNYAPTYNEYMIWNDACVSEEGVMAIPGKTSYRYDFTTAMTTTAQGVPSTLALPTTIANLEGTKTPSMTKVGSPTLLAQYGRSWG